MEITETDSKYALKLLPSSHIFGTPALGCKILQAQTSWSYYFHGCSPLPHMLCGVVKQKAPKSYAGTPCVRINSTSEVTKRHNHFFHCQKKMFLREATGF